MTQDKERISLLKEFKGFLYKYKIIGLAIAFVIGGASQSLIKSIVDGLIMPVITFFIPNGEWQISTLTIGSVVIEWGLVLAALINFLIIATVIFIIAKLLLKEEKKEEKVKKK